MARPKANEHEKLKLETTREQWAFIQPCDGPINERSYLWIGTYSEGCYGTVAKHKDIRTLRDWCNQILGET